MIYDILTEQNGLTSVLAKGIKKKKDGFQLQPFKALQLSYTNANLPILVKHEVETEYTSIMKKHMLIGLYFNELIYRLIPKNEPLPSLYSLYKSQLEFISESNHESDVIALRFEFLFLKELGYQLNLSEEYKNRIDINDMYYYAFGSGFKKVSNSLSIQSIISGASIKLLLDHKFSEVKDIKSVRNIIRKIIQDLLGNKSIKSFEIID